VQYILIVENGCDQIRALTLIGQWHNDLIGHETLEGNDRDPTVTVTMFISTCQQNKHGQLAL
jgi:hypothetical protein